MSPPAAAGKDNTSVVLCLRRKRELCDRLHDRRAVRRRKLLRRHRQVRAVAGHGKTVHHGQTVFERVLRRRLLLRYRVQRRVSDVQSNAGDVRERGGRNRRSTGRDHGLRELCLSHASSSSRVLR